MMKKEVLMKFNKKFHAGDVIKKEDLNDFIKESYPNISPASLAWRIYDLKKENYVAVKDTETYVVIDRDKFSPFEIENDESLEEDLKLFNKRSRSLKNRYGSEINIPISLWNTKILNRYTTHQTFMNFNIVEVDKDRTLNLYYFLKEKTYDVYMLKDLKGLTHLLSNNSIIIGTLPLRAPLENKKSFRANYVGYPKVEKLLVDIFVYNKIVLPYDNSEIENIYRNAFKKHVIKINSLLNYARIRGIRIRELVEDTLDRIGEFTDDKRK
jgi:hypothetical protein